MTDPNKCPECGKWKKPQFDLCFDCSQKRRDRGGSKGDSQRQDILPAECFFNSFLNEDGFPKKEIYLEAAETAASVFGRAGMSQSSIRSLFYMLKSMELRINADPKIEKALVNDAFYKFVVQTEYKTKCQVIPEIFGSFVRDHTDLATSSIPEFKGFVRYLTSILARMKTK